MLLTILVPSIIIQFIAAAMALLLIRKTGRSSAWILIASALSLMGIRRILSLEKLISSGPGSLDPTNEGMSLLISILMLPGVWLIRGVVDRLARLRITAEEQVKKREKAEADLRISLNQAEEAAARLRESEERLRFLSDNLPDGLVYQVDTGVDGQERQITYASGGIERLHEITVNEALKDPAWVYSHVVEEDCRYLADRERAAIATMSPFSVEVRLKLPSGKTKWRMFASAPRRLSNNHLVWDGMEIDITERRKAEEERQRIQAIERLGTVAGGIAHDFNNLLMGVFGNVELAKMELAPDHAAYASLENATQAMGKAKQLTGRLLTFAKGGQPVMETVDIRQVIRDTIQFNLTGSSVNSRLDIPDDLWPVKADSGQLAQVIASLTINAKEAMPAGGTIDVQAQNVHDPCGDTGPELRGDFVKISIKDSGVGIPPHQLERIFEPYFTTKQNGSGLGLAITYGIISRHKGHIRVDSTPNAGTTMTVFLPVDPEKRTRKQADQPGAPDRSNRPEHPPHGFGHILLMDDETVVRDVTSRMLGSLGYTTETAVDGREAIEKYQAAMAGNRPFDLTIMDLTIPGGMGGKEAIQKLLAIDPDATVIVASGYSSDPVLADFAKHGFAGSLVKPFHVKTLAEAISRLKKPPAAGV